MPHTTPWGELPDDGAVLVFDANDLWCGRHLRAAVDHYGTGRPLRYLILSHTHSDHAHGAQFFAPPARVLARAWAQQRLAYWAEQDLQPFVDETPQYAEEYRTLRIVIPDEAVEEVRRLDLGGVHVRLEPMASAHTEGDLVGVVEEDGVALCGVWSLQCTCPGTALPVDRKPSRRWRHSLWTCERRFGRADRRGRLMRRWYRMRHGACRGGTTFHFSVSPG